jgi:zinc transporter ZupT
MEAEKAQQAENDAATGTRVQQQQPPGIRTKPLIRLTPQQLRQQQQGQQQQQPQEQQQGQRGPRPHPQFDSPPRTAMGSLRNPRSDAFLRNHDHGRAGEAKEKEIEDEERMFKRREKMAEAARQERRLRGIANKASPKSGGGGIPVVDVTFMTFAMAGAAGLGALPFFFATAPSKRWNGLATGTACGVMLAASFDLIHEGQPYGPKLVVAGAVAGSLFIQWVQEWLESRQDLKFGSLRGSKARKTALMVGIMAAHAIGEGCGVGVSFAGERGWAQGVLTTLAIGVHNIPEGLAKAAVLVGQGSTPMSAMLWSIATCLPQPLLAVPAFVFVETFEAVLPFALGFAAGCMVWLVFAELLPDAVELAPKGQVGTAATLAAAALEGARMSFESLESSEGALLSPLGAGGMLLMQPALSVLLPAVAVAALAAGAVGRGGLQGPAALGAAAAIAATLGAGSLAHQIILAPGIPILHTVSAAVSGGAIALMLRRRLLLSAARQPPAGKPHHSGFGFKPSADSFPDLEGVTDGNGHHVVTSALGGNTGVSRRSHPSDWQLSSPSKSKSRALEDDVSKQDRRLSGPQLAAGVTMGLALSAEAVTLVSPVGTMLSLAFFPIKRSVLEDDGLY